MGDWDVKNSEKLQTYFMDGPLWNAKHIGKKVDGR